MVSRASPGRVQRRPSRPVLTRRRDQASRAARGSGRRHAMGRQPKCQYQPKICHPTIDAAWLHVRGIEEYERRRGREPRPGFVLEPYWCEAHQCYHIGHRRIVTTQANQPVTEESQ